MTRFNRKLEYALMALKYMSRKSTADLTTAKEVSDTFKTPFDATARVMQMMAQKGFLKSEHGAAGGYLIAQNLSTLTLLDIVEMIEGPTALVRCFQKQESCEMSDTCNIVSPITSLNRRLNDFYKDVTLKDLLSEGSGV